MWVSEEKIIPQPLDRDMLDESMSSDAGGSLSLSISLTGSSRHGSDEELDRDDPFWEFIDEPKHPQKEEDDEDEENEDDESAYDGDDDED